VHLFSLAFCLFFCFSLDYFVLGLFAFVVLGLVLSGFSALNAFSALTLLVGWQEGHPACKTEWSGTGVVIRP